MVFCKVILWPLTVGAPWKHFAALSALLEMFCGILSLHGIFLALVALLQNILRCSGYSLVFFGTGIPPGSYSMAFLILIGIFYCAQSPQLDISYGVLSPHLNILSILPGLFYCDLGPPGNTLWRSHSFLLIVYCAMNPRCK